MKKQMKKGKKYTIHFLVVYFTDWFYYANLKVN